MNPTQIGMNVGIKLNINEVCTNYRNLPCSKFESRGYYVTTNGSENALNTTTSFTTSSNLVLATGLTHNFSLILTNDLTSTGAIYIIYP